MPTVFCMTETQEDYIFCKHCGAPKRASAPFCTSCGGASSSDSDVAKSGAIGQHDQVGDKNNLVSGFLDSIDMYARDRRNKRQKAEQDRIRAEYERVHVITFNSQGEYNGWLQRAGPSIEIIDTTASPRRGLLYSGTIHKTTFTVTYKLRKPTPTQPAQPQVAAPIPPQQPPAIDIPEQIEKLGKLKEQGLLTEDDLQSKKQELLSRL
jgi:hypothetical protein